ncbi:13835_t:CDS:2 [Funneliformis caledonium]|uniref:13835_t:CDS:1 n=1 Tax=Funneliformis caledonium TaxID=1117310 RepID=A0A9N8VMW2_9GLOM|nr:13835_t:CDS:2 [Funneliformis caledonium]
MATEESVLNSFLLNSELADNLTLKQFNNLFPIAYRKNSLIKTLYREFQLERNRIRETIKENIVEESIETLAVAEKLMSREINKMNEDCKRSFEKIENINNELNDVVYGRIPKGGIGQADDIERLKVTLHACFVDTDEFQPMDV